MSTDDQVARAMLDNQAFALMGRLHVALRRGSGRVTDIEYMRIDPKYCRHVLDLVAGSESEDLRQIGRKLDALYFGEHGLFNLPESRPLLARAGAGLQAPQLRQQDMVLPELMASRAADAAPAADRAYIGRLR
jgi:hypothetical protein